MTPLIRRTGMALGLVAATALVPMETSAQECEAQVSPTVLPAGQEAVQVTVRLSEGVGAVTDVRAPESGIAMASPDDVPRTEMSAEEEARPVQMGADQTSWTVWLNTSRAQPGEYQVTFVAEEAGCVADVEVGAGR